MRKNTIFSGIAILIAGLIMAIFGIIGFNKAKYDFLEIGIFGDIQNYNLVVNIWLIFVLIGFIIFIAGIILIIVGFTFKEKKDIAKTIDDKGQDKIYEFKTMQSQKDKEKLVGIWTGTISRNMREKLSVNITFLSNGTYIEEIALDEDNGKWDIKYQKLTKKGEDTPKITYTYAFSDDNKNVVISNTLEYEIWTLTKSQ